MTDERKWTEYPLETLADTDALAEVIAAFLNSDETEPTGGDRSKWLSDVRLRELESKVVQNEQKYGKFAELCHMASARLTEPYGRALLLLGVLNGERRKLEDRDDDIVTDLIRRSAEAIDALSNGDRKNRLDGLLDYHKGIYARVVGDYRMAAECQRKSAEKAEKAGDISGLAISAFCQMVELVSAALVAGNRSVIHWCLQMLKVTGTFLKNVLAMDESADAVRWREMNYPSHMITSYFLAEAGIQTLLANDVGRLIDMLLAYVSNPDNAKHRPLAVLCQAIVSDSVDLAEDVWTGKVEGELYPEYKAIAGLLLAHSASNQGRDEAAAGYYDAIIKMDGPIHVVRAIATRELTQLTSPK